MRDGDVAELVDRVERLQTCRQVLGEQDQTILFQEENVEIQRKLHESGVHRHQTTNPFSIHGVNADIAAISKHLTSHDFQ